MIELKINEKAFSKKTIFHDTEIKIDKGEFIAIKGQSGIGKSTLIKMIGMLENFNGTYKLHGSVMDKKNRESLRNANFAYLFQEPMLIPFYSVYENVTMPLKNLRQQIDQKYVDDILSDLSLIDLKYSGVTTLSGGEATRVAIARAMLSDRRIIIADEPTGNLDYDNAIAVMNILKSENQKGKTIILVTHSNEFDDFYSRTVYIKNKTIIG